MDISVWKVRRETKRLKNLLDSEASLTLSEGERKRKLDRSSLGLTKFKEGPCNERKVYQDCLAVLKPELAVRGVLSPGNVCLLHLYQVPSLVGSLPWQVWPWQKRIDAFQRAAPQTLHAHCSRLSAMYIPVAATHGTPFMHTLIWFRGVQLLEMSIGLVSAAGYFSNVNVPQRLVLHSTWKLANRFYRDWLGRGWRRALAKSVTTALSKGA